MAAPSNGSGNLVEEFEESFQVSRKRVETLFSLKNSINTTPT